MAITVKHKFVSAIPDAGDTTIVQPSNWNDDHQLSGTVPVANGGTGASTLTGYVKGNGTSAMTAATTVPNTDVTGLGTASTKDAGVANGVATLDSSGQVPLSQIPPLGDLNYQGTWNATTNSPTLTSSVGTKGFYYVVSVAGTTNLNGITDWQIGDWAVFNGSVWQKIDNTDAVTSVNGYTGTVVLTAADVGAVPYTGATGAVDLNAKTLVNVSNLGVNTTTVPTIKIRAVGDNNSGSRIAMRGYSSDANSSSIRVTKFRGTTGAPQAPLSGDSLGKFELAGYGTTSSEGYPQSSLEGVATENWGAIARGAKAVIKVTPNTTITQVIALTIDQDSKATFANTVTANGVLLTGNTGTVTSVTGTAPVVSSGGNTPAISMAAATTSVNGYLTSTDWNTFNGKAPAVTYTTNYIPYGQGTTTPNQSAGLQFDGTNFTTTGYATATSFRPSSSTVPTNGLYLPAVDAVGMSTATTERMRISSTGVVSMGTTIATSNIGWTPSLVLAAANNNALILKGVNTQESALALQNGYYIDVSGSSTGTNNFIAFRTTSTNSSNAPSERMRVHATGGVSIGNTTDAGAGNLSVTGTISTSKSITAGGTAGDVLFGRYDATYPTSGAGYFKLATNNTGAADGGMSVYTLIAGTLTESTRFSTSGGVSIGNTTDSGAGNLSVAGSASAASFIPTSSTVPTTGTFLPAANTLGFSTSTGEAMRIDNGGRLLMGTTSNGLITAKQCISSVAGEFGTAYQSPSNGGIYYHIVFGANTTNVGSITSTITTTTYGITSDERLKTNVAPANSALSSILSLPIDQFDWIVDNSHQEFGGIAQKLLPIIPEMVFVPTNPDEMMNVDWSKAVPRLIKAFQELNDKFDAYAASHP